MDYDALEIELVGVLNTYFGANYSGDVLLNTVFGARVFPDNPSDLLQDYTKGLVNVLYFESTYDQVDSTSTIRQTENVHVTCFFQCNRVRGVGGVNNLISASKKALLGYQPAGATTRMWISDAGGWAISNGEVRPLLEFTFQTVAGQAIDDSAKGPTIDSIDSVNSGGPLVQVDSELYFNDVADGSDEILLQ